MTDIKLNTIEEALVAIREGQFMKYSINTTVFDGMVMWLMQFKKI